MFVFHHCEECTKTRLALCVMLINNFVDKAALKGRRQRINCLLQCRVYTLQLEREQLMCMHMDCFLFVFLQLMIFQ